MVVMGITIQEAEIPLWILAKGKEFATFWFMCVSGKTSIKQCNAFPMKFAMVSFGPLESLNLDKNRGHKSRKDGLV